MTKKHTDVQAFLRKLKTFGPVQGDLDAEQICGLSYDSRKVKKGDIFFCLPGEKTDGNEFISDAIASGASLIVTEVPAQSLSVPQVVVNDIRLVLADCAATFYGDPSKSLRLIGVTGTNGKTTSTHLIEHIMTAAEKKIGLIGTLGARYPGQSSYGEAKHTTPQAPELQALLAEIKEAGSSHVAMEVSSHALFLKRVESCHFAVACLTNITQDHLDFHRTMDNYAQAKRILFSMLNRSEMENKTAVINIDDPRAAFFIEGLSPSLRLLTYGFSPEAQIRAEKTEFRQGRTHVSLHTPWAELELKLKLAGRFNVYNVMTAVAACLSEGVDPSLIGPCLEDFAGVPGRFERVLLSEDADEPLCLVDYAHTPDGLENVLKTASELKMPGKKLIVVFGCGGDRDPSKRPKMGAIAENLADLLVVTSDNPRSEDPEEIIANILSGISRMKNVSVEPDRMTAIRLAVSAAGPGDVVVVAGKGHENYQLIKDKVLDFDDRVEVKQALAERARILSRK